MRNLVQPRQHNLTASIRCLGLYTRYDEYDEYIDIMYCIQRHTANAQVDG
jgi:hypothetical protein